MAKTGSVQHIDASFFFVKISSQHCQSVAAVDLQTRAAGEWIYYCETLTML